MKSIIATNSNFWVNNNRIIDRFYIYKSNYMKEKLCVFHKEFSSFITALKLIKKYKNATQLLFCFTQHIVYATNFNVQHYSYALNLHRYVQHLFTRHIYIV